MDTFKKYSLSFESIIEAPNDILNNFFETVSRNEVIEWLSWNDRNGVYEDSQSLKEFGNILSKNDGIEIMRRQIEENK